MTAWTLLKFLHIAAVIAVFSIQIASDLYFQQVAASGSTEAVAKLGGLLAGLGLQLRRGQHYGDLYRH
jgi:glutaminase